MEYDGTAEHCCICIPGRACVKRFVDLPARVNHPRPPPVPVSHEQGSPNLTRFEHPVFTGYSVRCALFHGILKTRQASKQQLMPSKKSSIKWMETVE